MSKFVQAFLTGIFFTFILDFFLFLGIKLNYTDFYEMDIYYNILFADHQNIYIYLAFSALIGFIIMYLHSKISLWFLTSLFVLVSFTLLPPVGHYVGERMLMTKNVTFKNDRHTFTGDVYYNGRKKIVFYDYELQKIISLDQKELKK